MLQLKQVQQSFPFFFSSVELHCGCYTLNPKNLCPSVKLWFTNMYFVGFYSVSNLIVIIFNLVFPVSIVWFDCKGSVLERENVKTQASEARRLLAGVSRLSFPRSEACTLHMTEMRRVSTGWKHLCFVSISRIRPPARHLRDILLCQSVLSDTHFLYPHYIYPYYPQMQRRASERKP